MTSRLRRLRRVSHVKTVVFYRCPPTALATTILLRYPRQSAEDYLSGQSTVCFVPRLNFELTVELRIRTDIQLKIVALDQILVQMWTNNGAGSAWGSGLLSSPGDDDILSNENAACNMQRTCKRRRRRKNRKKKKKISMAAASTSTNAPSQKRGSKSSTHTLEHVTCFESIVTALSRIFFKKRVQTSRIRRANQSVLIWIFSLLDNWTTHHV